MRNTLNFFGILLMSVVLVMSCSKDNNDPDKPNNEATGKYKVTIEGKVFEGTGKIGVLNNIASIGDLKDFGILISSVPSSGEKTIDSNCTVTIIGKNILKSDGNEESYLSTSGTVTRVSETKISFKVQGKDLADWIYSPIYSFEGSIESSAYKNI